MSSKSWAIVLLLVARVLAWPAQAFAAPSMFYVEVPKDGQIYVFAMGERFASFETSGREEVGEPVIIRHGYGPNGETVVFDSEDAINLWYIHPSIRVGPNVELVKYDHDPDPVDFPGQDETRLYRLNFFWTF